MWRVRLRRRFFFLAGSSLTALALLAALAAAPAPAAGQTAPARAAGSPDTGGCRPLIEPARGADGGLPAGWTVRTVGGEDRPRLRTARTPGGDTVLRIRSADEAAFVHRSPDPAPRGDGTLRWRWRTPAPIPSADLRDPDRDDSPIRVFVVFGAGSASELGDEGRAIFYTWGNREAPGATFRSHVSERIAVKVLRAAGDADGSWRSETVRPAHDYRAIFTDEPPPIGAVGLLPDTDQTGATAVAEVGLVRWCPGGG